MRKYLCYLMTHRESFMREILEISKFAKVSCSDHLLFYSIPYGYQLVETSEMFTS